MPSESPNKTQWGPERSYSPEVNNKIDSYKTSIKNHFYSNPDSAIYYYLKIIDLYRGQNMPYNIFDANVQVSELYLKKSDGANAVYYYGEALKIKNKNVGIEDTNPYFFIDMGNMFYVNNLLPQAKSSYNKAIAIAAQMKNGFAMSVAQNNIGLVCQKEADYNSSCNFFKKSLELRKKEPLYVAHNYFYLASVFAKQNIPDSILYYRSFAMEALNRHSLIPVDSDMVKQSSEKTLVDDCNVYEAELMAISYNLKKEYEQAIHYYQIAFYRANKIKDLVSASSYQYSLAILYDKIHNQKQALESAELSYQMALLAKNDDGAATSAKLLNQFYTHRGNLLKAHSYLQKALYYTETINQREASQKKESAEIFLITNQVEDSLRIYRLKEERSSKVIRSQSLAIVLGFFLFVLASIHAYFHHKKRMRLNMEDLMKKNEMLKNIEIDERLRDQKKNGKVVSLSQQLEVRLAILMDIEVVYTQHDISLAKLAALLDTNTTYLSQYFNLQLETSFNDYINSYRVKEACRIFDRDTLLKYSIDQVADMVGFSSRTTFYTAFKKFTGMTPAFFQKNISNLNLKTQLLELPSGKK